MTARAWTLRLVYPKLPLSLNDRAHWAEVARSKRNLRDRVRLLARQQKIPRLDAIHVQMHWTPAVKRNRDEDNCMLTQKVMVDGLRDYRPTKRDPIGWTGVVPDDTPEHVTWSPPILHDPDPKVTERLWLVITEVAACTPTEGENQ